MTRTTLVCQVPTCRREFHDVAEYYDHVESHEMEKKRKEK